MINHCLVLLKYFEINYSIKFSLSFNINNSVKNLIPSRRRLTEKMCPAIENIRSTAAEEAWTLRYFLASKAKPGNTISCIFQNSKASLD